MCKKCNKNTNSTKCDKVSEKFGCFVPGKGPIEVPIYRATSNDYEEEERGYDPNFYTCQDCMYEPDCEPSSNEICSAFEPW